MNLGMKLRFKPDRHGRFPIRLSLIPSSVSPGHRKPTGTVPLYHFPFRVRQIATTGPAPVPIFLLLIFPFTSPALLSFHFSFFFYYFINSVRYSRFVLSIYPFFLCLLFFLFIPFFFSAFILLVFIAQIAIRIHFIISIRLGLNLLVFDSILRLFHPTLRFERDEIVGTCRFFI